MKELAISVDPHVKVTPVSLELKQSTTFKDWTAVFIKLRQIEGAVAWWIGDALNFGEQKFGEIYAQIVDDVGYSYKTLANMKYVASRVEKSRRRENVSWSKHAEVASLDAKDQVTVLKKVQEEELTVKQTRKVVKSVQEGLPMPKIEICPECKRPL